MPEEVQEKDNDGSNGLDFYLKTACIAESLFCLLVLFLAGAKKLGADQIDDQQSHHVSQDLNPIGIKGIKKRLQEQGKKCSVFGVLCSVFS
ncbi:MAG: hypothetical protein WBN49_08555 [Arenicellales bacterium]